MESEPVSAASLNYLETALSRFPRLSLGELPTPLEHMPRLSQELRRPLYVKRDDQIGPGLGGNKTRKLEYLLAEARHRGARKVATFGGLQSNHARLTAAAAVRFGFEPHLFYFERRPKKMTGNLLVNRLIGARMHFIPFGGGGGMSLEASVRFVKMIATARIGPHYFIPVGGHSRTGCLGYVQAALEIDTQIREMGLERPWLVTAVGTGGTLAGLMAGLALSGSSIQLLGIDVGKLWKGFPSSIAHMATRLCQGLGYPQTFAPEDVPIIEETYVGEAYGKPTSECLGAVKRLACSEGLLIDPIYTGKAFAGLIDLLERDALGDKQPVIFLHTGGAPALFAIDPALYP
jgi:D-cysteine desulfhydrase family pyridoxal phosphate-dependent enzyme